MDIDQRIEALIQSVELLASFHKDMEEQIKETDKKWAANMVKMVDIAESLTRMIAIHDERLNGHDTRLDNLEH
jgi:phage-related tail protein